jgi:ADP-ribosylglycohydrolase
VDRYEGCIIGGAVGDALGWPAEFLSLADIRARYGEEGITGLDVGIGTKAEITDDTQMTIFTADGLLRFIAASREKGSSCVSVRNTVDSAEKACTDLTALHNNAQTSRQHSDLADYVHESYLRWLLTQGEKLPENYPAASEIANGWLMEIKALYHRRAPGNTCIAALRSGMIGTMEKPVNNSKGCGGIMRAAPAGLVTSREEAFLAGARVAAVTHGHPSGYLAAGALSYIIRCIIDGMDIDSAVDGSISELEKYEGSRECVDAVIRALQLASEGNPDAEKVSMLGEGWVAEETLAIAIYCSLAYRNDFRKAVLLAVNHSGDSDSTGAVTGNIMGAYLGIEAIPEMWSYGIELSAELRELAGDLRKMYRDHDIWRYKYPA